MKYSYYKRMEKGKVLQIWLEIVNKEGIKLIPYMCERDYYGEGLKKDELIEIALDEFKDLGRMYNCLSNPKNNYIPDHRNLPINYPSN
jgi:hypothetical protein